MNAPPFDSRTTSFDSLPGCRDTPLTPVRGKKKSRQLRLEANPSRVEPPITDHLKDFAPDLKKYEGGNLFFPP
jgi:hypothetical protein